MDMDMHCLALSRAPPLYPPKRLLCETPQENFADALLKSEPYRQWVDQRGTCVLHLHGRSGVSDMTRQLPGLLKGSKDGEGVAILFEFNRRDVRFGNVKALLASMLAILCSRRSHVFPTHIRELIQRSYCEHDGSLDNLYATLERIQIQRDGPALTFVVGRLDECDGSREWLVKRLAMRRGQRHRYRFPWIISSQGSDSIRSELSGWPGINLDESDLVKDSYLRTSPDQLLLPSYLRCGFRPFSEEELAILASLQRAAVQDSERNAADGKSHAIMASLCLKYLRDPAVQAQMMAVCRRAALTRPPLYTDHRNLIAYATSSWPLHYKLSGDDRPFQSAVDFFNDCQARNVWSSVHYVLRNSGSWLNRCYLSPLPLMAMHGLDDLVSEWLHHRQEDCASFQTDGALAIREAVRWGHVSTARLLLAAMDLNGSALSDALTAAASFGEGEMIHELARKASTVAGFQWPRFLLHRLAFLHLHDTVKVLLDSGVQVKMPQAKARGMDALHYSASSACYGYNKTLQLLLAANADANAIGKGDFTALYLSAAMGSPESIKILLDAGAAIDAQTDVGVTPLQVALYYGNIGAFEILLESGADPNHGKQDRGDTEAAMKPLFYCAYHGLVEEAKQLLAHKADINVKYWGGKLSAAYFAVDGGYVEVAELLLQNGADANENPEDWDLILLAAVSHRDEAKSLAMARLLLDHGARIDEEDNSSSWRSTALSRAAGLESTEVVKLLLDRGADVNHRGTDSESPLYAACYSCRLANVKTLIAAGANVNEEPDDPDNWSPIHACYDNAEIVRTLLDNGADANRLAERQSCLHLAVRNHEPDTVRVLLAHRPKVDLELARASPSDDDDNYTALCLVCLSGNGARIARQLLDAGANADHQTELGKRPLDICVEAGSTAVARVLLEYRIPVDTVDNDGNTPLHHVSPSTERTLIKLLVRAGVDPWKPNNKGATPLRRAVEVGNSAVVKYLLSRNPTRNGFLDAAPGLVHSACQNGDLQTLKALVKAGADISSIDSQTTSSGLLVTAIDGSRTPDQDLVEYLVETAGVNINGPGGLFGYPLIAACAYGHEEQVQYLVKHGADIDLKDSIGRTALHMASVHGILTVVEAFLSAAAGPPHTVAISAPPRDSMGRTPVHFAAASGNWDVFQHVSGLYDEKELTEPDYDGWTPLFWALRNRTSSGRIVEHLIEHGADPWGRDQGGNGSWSPVKLAKYIGAPEDVHAALASARSSSPPSRDKPTTRPGEEFSHNSQPAHNQREWVCSSCELVS